jgi:hypothetical protein
MAGPFIVVGIGFLPVAAKHSARGAVGQPVCIHDGIRLLVLPNARNWSSGVLARQIGSNRGFVRQLRNSF